MKNRTLSVGYLVAALACGVVFGWSNMAQAAMSEAQCGYFGGMCQQNCDTVQAGGSQKVVGTCITNNGVGEQNFCCAPKDTDINAPKPQYTDADCTNHFALCAATCKATDAVIGSCTKGGKQMSCCQSKDSMEKDSKYMAKDECASKGGSCASNSCAGSTTCEDLGMCYQPQLATEKVGYCIKSTVPGVKTPTTTGGTSGGTGGTSGGGSDKPPAPPASGLAQLPCESSGDCSVDSIVQKGVNFAIFIMGLSGALFLLVFVYGGAMYVLSFGKSSWVDKGKKAMIQACIGIVLVMGAWTVVYYVSSSIGYKAPAISSSTEKGGTKGVCGTATGTEGRTCMDVNGAGKGKDCLQSYCSGAANIQCCK